MVQIIQSDYVFVICPLTQLYIPHGSDNTLRGLFRFGRRIGQLYIPHGSDNTKWDKSALAGLDILYIPHGSDNTETVLRC